MGRPELEAILRQPETLRQILGDYRGPYSIELSNAFGNNKYKISLIIPCDDYEERIFDINIGGLVIPVVVQGGLGELSAF